MMISKEDKEQLRDLSISLIKKLSLFIIDYNLDDEDLELTISEVILSLADLNLQLVKK